VARFFLEKREENGRVEISGPDAHHINSVLRLKEGDTIECVAETGLVHLVEITGLEAEVVFGRIRKTFATDQEPPLYLTLFQGLAKGDRMDFAVQKAVELGAAEIMPFTSRHTVVRLKEKQAQNRVHRWQRIALAAAKQCGRTRVPQVGKISSFADLLAEVQKRSREKEVVLLPYEGERQLGLKEITNAKPRRAGVIIGPEGGFHEDEVRQLKEGGAVVISLGPRILRTETAGVVALSLLGYKWGDLG